MPPIPPNQLVPGTAYTVIQRANPGHINGYGTSSIFLGLSQQGWPRFTVGHSTSQSNPAVFDFYLPNDPTIPGGIPAGVAPLVQQGPAGQAPLVQQGQQLPVGQTQQAQPSQGSAGVATDGGRRRKNRKNKKTKKRKTNRKNKSRKH